MPNKMLIDASHPEETRVVVTRGNRIEEFDFESQDKKQLRGNIYLARVTRVEPSLQAAFVEYGGNRHGFLAFSEIHPDYYQIPVADRQALLLAEAEAAENDDDEESEDEERNGDRNGRGRRRRRGRNRGRPDEARTKSGEDAENGEIGAVESSAETAAEQTEEILAVATEEIDSEVSIADSDDETPKTMAAAVDLEVVSEAAPSADEDRGTVEEIEPHHAEESEIESVGAGDALDEVRTRRKPARRHYKIQEVIKRRQILLVQVVKEERGNKGAALTTYLSLAGRYSVLMPNTARGGGISRKITSVQDRKRLKDVMKDLDVPQGMGVILRTAGENRTKAEIKRDDEYLMRLWENVRNLTLASTAPALVYEEGSLIKRSVRDLYNKDIEEILVAGEDGYREAKDFMRMLMPSHAKMVQPYRDTTPIFARNGIEAQLDRMLQPQVTLKSGGYIIINQTEALVSIDVNSGRSTREHSIEDTALKTNLEAADEVARQLRLRDLAGLIVIDFIDMEEGRNNRAVEKKLKDCLKNDRARIQVGRISHFGLMEMSRQRIRASVLESTMKPCPHCGGTGHVRSDSSVALLVVRAIEEHLLKDPRHHILVKTPSATALYVLNHKRGTLSELEQRFGLTITIEVDEDVGSQHYAILKGAVVENPVLVIDPPSFPVEEEEEDIVVVEESEDESPSSETRGESAGRNDSDNGDGSQRKRRRRRRRRGGKDRDQQGSDIATSEADGDESAADETGDDGDDESPISIEQQDEPLVEVDEQSDGEKKKRRRGKRGGRTAKEAAEAETTSGDAAADVAEPVTEAELESEKAVDNEKPAKPARRPRKTTAKSSKSKAAPEAPIVAEVEEKTAAPVIAAAMEATEEVVQDEAERRNRRKPVVEAPVEPKVSSTAEIGETPPKKGWWQRKGFF